MEKKYGPDDPRSLAACVDLAGCLEAQAKLEDAEPLYRYAVKKQGATLGGDHADTLASVDKLASVYIVQ
eukprot:177610-Chlamydomonas_euryale.AAC.1